MQQLKESTEWRIAATYYVIGGLFIPRGINFIYTLILAKIIQTVYIPIYLLIAFDFATIIMALWLGTSCAAKYINKRFIIRNKNNIVKNAVIAFVLIQLIGVGSLLGRQNIGSFGLILLESIFATGLFYFLSNKYIRNTEIISSEGDLSLPLQ